MSELQDVPITVVEGRTKIDLRLLRKKNPGGPPVLILHGASAKSDTFRIPAGVNEKNEPRCLIDWLYEKNYEPWLLDWRGSGTIAARELGGLLRTDRDLFDFDHAARSDIPAALKLVAHEHPRESIAVIGHCMGGGILAQAIADERIDLDDYRVTHIVLSTLGLFYEPPLDSRLKSEDYTLERLLRRPVPAIDPRRRPKDKPREWPKEFEELYLNWPTALHPHRGQTGHHVEEMCDRLSFMYGAPYRERNLAPEIHHRTIIVHFRAGNAKPKIGDTIRAGEARAVLHSIHHTTGEWAKGEATGRLNLIQPSGKPFKEGKELRARERRFATAVSVIGPTGPELPKQFGPIPLPMFAQGARNMRRRFAAPFDKGSKPDEKNTYLVSDRARREFLRLKKVTLLTGARNTLWHRDSIDRMYEWLCQGRNPPNVEKVIFPSYGHQDLYWGEHASIDVFPRILEGLPPTVDRTVPETSRPSRWTGKSAS